MQTTWFAIALVFLILSMGGLVTAAVLCFCKQRVPTPRHPHNAHNAQSHPPVSFPCESQKTPLTCTRSIRIGVVATARSRCNRAAVSRLVLCGFTSRTVNSKHRVKLFSLWVRVMPLLQTIAFPPYARARKNKSNFRKLNYQCWLNLLRQSLR